MYIYRRLPMKPEPLQRLRTELRGAGISEVKIFQIPESGNQGLIVEDLVDAEVYVQAVNEELFRSYGSTYAFPDNKMPVTGRPTAVKRWCEDNGIDPPKKTAVAYRALEKGEGRSVLAKPYHKPIK
jgi:hypothetical protein